MAILGGKRENNSHKKKLVWHVRRAMQHGGVSVVRLVFAWECVCVHGFYLFLTQPPDDRKHEKKILNLLAYVPLSPLSRTYRIKRDMHAQTPCRRIGCGGGEGDGTRAEVGRLSIPPPALYRRGGSWCTWQGRRGREGDEKNECMNEWGSFNQNRRKAVWKITSRPRDECGQAMRSEWLAPRDASDFH